MARKAKAKTKRRPGPSPAIAGLVRADAALRAGDVPRALRILGETITFPTPQAARAARAAAATLNVLTQAQARALLKELRRARQHINRSFAILEGPARGQAARRRPRTRG
jgi:hypothetical protein